MTNGRSSGRRRAASGSIAGAGHVVTPDTVSDVVVAEVVRLYRDEGRSMVAVGLVFGRGPDWVRARLVAAGCTIRPGGGAPVSGADLDELARWRVEEGLTIAEVAARAGRPAATVADQLRKAGVLVERGRRRPPELDPAVLRSSTSTSNAHCRRSPDFWAAPTTGPALACSPPASRFGRRDTRAVARPRRRCTRRSFVSSTSTRG